MYNRGFLALAILALALATHSTAAVIQFDDSQGAIVSGREQNDPVRLIFDGQVITGDGGRIRNFNNTVPEQISFDLQLNIAPLTINFVGFTNLADQGGDDPPNTVSDRFLMQYTANSSTVHIVFGSDPNLPDIPAGAVDFRTVERLDVGPVFETGNFQTVAVFRATNITSGAVLDSFLIRSDVPEPGTILVVGAGLVLLGIVRRIRV